MFCIICSLHVKVHSIKKFSKWKTVLKSSFNTDNGQLLLKAYKNEFHKCLHHTSNVTIITGLSILLTLDEHAFCEFKMRQH